MNPEVRRAISQIVMEGKNVGEVLGTLNENDRKEFFDFVAWAVNNRLVYNPEAN